MEFTYDFGNEKKKRETYEWDRTWIDHANDNTGKRYFYIGDSIAWAVRIYLKQLIGDKYYVDGYSTSKTLSDEYYYETIKLLAKQLPKTDGILFNFGLHGWSLEDDIEYKEFYEKALKFLMELFPNKPIHVVLTTAVKGVAHEERVEPRNRVAKEIAKKYGLKVLDLYSVAKENADKLSPDGVHFSEEGYIKLAEALGKFLG